MPAADAADPAPPAPARRVRLFTALELPAATRDALAARRDEQIARDAAWRPVAHGALHVTLCFLGWRARDDAGPIARVLERCAAGVPGVELEVGAGALLPPRRPRVLAVDLHDGGGVLGAFQAALAGELAAAGLFEPVRRPSRAGGTVAARARTAPRPRRRELPPPGAPAFRAPAATLYRSRLERGGARYEPLVSAALGGA